MALLSIKAIEFMLRLQASAAAAHDSAGHARPKPVDVPPPPLPQRLRRGLYRPHNTADAACQRCNACAQPLTTAFALPTGSVVCGTCALRVTPTGGHTSCPITAAHIPLEAVIRLYEL